MEKFAQREFLKKGENAQTQNYPKIPPKEKKFKKKPNNIENKTTGTKALHELAKRRESMPFQWVEQQFASNMQDRQLLAVLNRCNMVSCNVLHARGIQEPLPSAWRASKHSC